MTAGVEDRAARVDEGLDDGIPLALVLGLDVVDPSRVLHVRVVPGDHL
jgi:hypothetical protein